MSPRGSSDRFGLMWMFESGGKVCRYDLVFESGGIQLVTRRCPAAKQAGEQMVVWCTTGAPEYVPLLLLLSHNWLWTLASWLKPRLHRQQQQRTFH